MKRMLDKIKRGEKGQVLIIAVVLMLLGGLIIGPVVAYVGSGLKVGKDVHEERMDELYAADAGVEDGLWYIQDIERLKQLVQDLDEGGYVPPPGWMPADYADWPLLPYDPTDPDDPSDNINDKDVAVTVEYLPDGTFKITSEATSADGSSTRIDAYVEGLDFSNLLENAITSLSEVTLQSEAEVNEGDVVYCTGDPPSEDQVNPPGEVIQDCEVAWPTADELSEWYFDQVENAPSYVGETTILFDSDTVIGPLYVDGNLTLRSTENDVTLTLLDTVYVTGTLETDQNKTFTLNFNNQTIFVESNEEYPPGAVNVSWKTSVEGSGCLIAIGGIDFGPNVVQGDPDEDNFLFVMSIDDTTFAHPQGIFNGSFAGNVEVQLQPHGNITWNDPDDNDLNFPMGDYAGGELMIVISAWEITLEGSD